MNDLMMWLAYDMSNTEEFRKKLEQERLDNLTEKEEGEYLMRIFGVSDK